MYYSFEEVLLRTQLHLRIQFKAAIKLAPRLSCLSQKTSKNGISDPLANNHYMLLNHSKIKTSYLKNRAGST